MPIPKQITENLAKKIVKSLSDKDLIATGNPNEKLQFIIDDIITEDLNEVDFENKSQTDTPKRILSQSIAQLKEQLAEQKDLFRKSEKEKTKLINKGHVREDSLTDFFKKKYEQEKLSLTDKIKSFEDKNKKYEQELQNVSDAIIKLPAIKEELKNIQELLASEKKMQEKLLQEKELAENKLEKAEAELKASLTNEKNSSLVKDSIEKIKSYKDENSKLQKKLSLLTAKFKKEKDTSPSKDNKDLEVAIEEFKSEIKELQKKLMTVQVEKEELNKHKEELLSLQEQQNLKQNEDKTITREITDELNLQDEQNKNFKMINELNDQSFNVYKDALNSKQSYEDRIKKLDIFIRKTKEHIEKITSENNDADSSENYSLEVLEYFSSQIDKKEAIKKILIEQRKLSSEVDKEDQPVIIQKKVIKKHSAHGGSWKVAYADFVTAMMAFFLMLWLLSMLSQDARDNLKEYFKSYKAFKHTGEEIKKGRDSVAVTDSVRTSNIQNKLLNQKRMIEEFKNRFKGADEHLKVIEVPGGVRIQVMDIMDKPMFKVGSAKLKPEAKEIFEFLSERIKKLPGKLIIEGHTDGLKFAQKEKTNWELSMERASTARLQLVKNGVDETRINRIIAYGFSEPLNEDDFFDPRNRRINIIIQNIVKKQDIEDRTNGEGMADPASH